jgi:hypothetical protein
LSGAGGLLPCFAGLSAARLGTSAPALKSSGCSEKVRRRSRPLRQACCQLYDLAKKSCKPVVTPAMLPAIAEVNVSLVWLAGLNLPPGANLMARANGD